MTSPAAPKCPPDPVTAALKALRTCAATQLGLCGRPVCRFPIVFNGQQPPADGCDCTCDDGDGQGWVRLATLNRAASTTNVAACFNQTYDVELGVGVYRCVPVPTGRDATVPEHTETEHALGMMLDAAALRRAVTCCERLDDLSLTTPIINHESASGPQGGCVGVELRCIIELADCGCPDTTGAAR